MIPPDIHAIAFDAVGTLIHPSPGAAEVYWEAGRRHGSRLDLADIRQRFKSAFTREEDADRTAGYRTSEERERERWRRIVGRVLDDVRDPQACFNELFEHFGKPSAWSCASQTDEVLQELTGRGYWLALASNYDRRLRSVHAGLPALGAVRTLVISSEVGWRKPAPEFFHAVSRHFALPPARILHVGDDPANDYEGARAAGLRALLLDPDAIPAPATICHLDDLLKGERGITLFVYGTLKRGCRSHHLLAGQEFLGPAWTVPRYRLLRRERYPCLVEAEQGVAIHGEIWRVDEDAVKRLDAYEGTPTLFARRPIRLADCDRRVCSYFFDGEVAGLPECGDDWRE